jgi:hypothetical protein
MKTFKHYCLAFMALLSVASWTATAAISVGDTITMDGVKYKVPDGTNLIPNPGFEDGLTSWKAANNTAMIAANFTVKDTGGINNSKYLVGIGNTGSTAVGSIGTSWPIEVGKGYLMKYYVRWQDTTKASATQSYLKVSTTNTYATETKVLIAASQVNKGVWTLNEVAFTAQHQNVQVFFRWLNSQFGFDHFSLIKLDSIGLDLTAIDVAIANAKTFIPLNYPGLTALNAAIDSAVVSKTRVASPADITATVNALTLAVKTYKLTKIGTATDPADYTGAIVNPGFDATANNVVPTGWTITYTNGNGYTGTGQHYSLDAANRYIDSWNATAGNLIYQATQTVTTLPNVSVLPNGLYTVTAAARASGTGVYIFAGDSAKQAPVNNDTNGALGKGWNTVTVDSVVVMNNAITFGAKTVKGWTGTWFSADDFTLTYHGVDVNLYKKTLTSLADSVARMDLTKIPNGIDAQITRALDSAKVAVSETSILAAATALIAARDSATLAVAPYATLKTLIDTATVTSDSTSYAGLTVFKAAIAAATTVYNGAATLTVNVNASIATLNKAILTYLFTQPASDSIPANFTFALVNPSFELGNMNGWTATTGASDMGAKLNTNATYTMTPCDGKYLFNVWNSAALSFFVQQEVSGLPNGLYKLIATATSDSSNVITLYANGQQKNIIAQNKIYAIEDTVFGIKVTDGKLKFGAKSSSWFKADNFRLIYVPAKDVTSLIINPTFVGTDNNAQPEGWTVTKIDGNTITTTGQHYSGVTTNRYLDSWNGTAGKLNYHAQQVIKNIPNGIYNVIAAARTSGLGSYIYANDKVAEITNNGNTGGTLGGGWSNITVETVVVMDSTITIGAKTEPGKWKGTWFSVDDFSMKYFGNADSATFRPYLDSLIVKAKAFDLSTSPDGVDTLLLAAITVAETVTTESALLPAFASLNSAYNVASNSVAPFAEFKALIDTATSLAAKTSYAGLSAFNTAIAAANTVKTASTTVTSDVNTAIAALNKAIFDYKITQPASKEAPADFTFAIANPSFELGNLNGWVTNTGSTDIGAKENSDATYTMTPCDGKYLFNVWGGTTLPFFVQQTITGLPNGAYTMSARYASDASNTITLYMNAQEKACTASTTGKAVSLLDSISYINVTAGEILLGAKSQTWFKADDFRLTYFGTYIVGLNNPKANIAVISRDHQICVQGTTQYEVYGVNGIRFMKDAKLQNGIYIVKAEGQTFRVAVF